MRHERARSLTVSRMTDSAAPTSSGSRTAGYLVAGGLASFPIWAFLLPWMGVGGATAALVVAWASGIVWLLRRREEDPAWDRSQPQPRR